MVDAAPLSRGDTAPLLIHADDAQDLPGPELPAPSSFGETSLLLRIGPGLLLGTFIANFDLSYLITNYSGRIASDLHQLQNAVWIILAGSIAGSCFQPLYASCANKYGRRLTILVGSSLSTIGLLLCSICTTLWELSLSRVVVGAGGSGLGLLTTIILNDVVPLSHLALWRSVITITTTAGLMSGGPLGARILSLTNWHIPFLIEGLLMLLAVGLIYVTLRVPSAPAPTPSLNITPDETIINYDILGGIAMILTLGMPLLVLNMAGGVVQWSHPAVITLLSLTPVMLAVLLFIQGCLVASPIFPAKFFTTVPVLLVNLLAIAVVFSWNQIVFNLSFYSQIRDIDGNFFQNWVLSCVFLGQPVGALASGLVISKTKAVKVVLGGSILLASVLYISIAVGWIHPENPAFAPILLMFGVGIGSAESSLTVALLGTVDKPDQAALYALFDLVVAFSGDIGITVSSAMSRGLTLMYLRKALDDSKEAAEIIKGATESLDYVRSLPAATRALVIDSFIRAIQNTFLVSAVVMVLALCFVPFLKITLDDPEEEEEAQLDLHQD